VRSGRKWTLILGALAALSAIALLANMAYSGDRHPSGLDCDPYNEAGDVGVQQQSGHIVVNPDPSEGESSPERAAARGTGNPLDSYRVVSADENGQKVIEFRTRDGRVQGRYTVKQVNSRWYKTSTTICVKPNS